MTRLHVSPISGTGALIYRSGNALAYLVGVPVASLDKVAERLANAEPVAWMAVLQAFQVTGAAVIDESGNRTRLRYTGTVEIQVLNGSSHPNEPDGALFVGTDDVRIMHLAVDDRLRINPRPDSLGIGNLEGGSMAVDSLVIRVGDRSDSPDGTDDSPDTPTEDSTTEDSTPEDTANSTTEDAAESTAGTTGAEADTAPDTANVLGTTETEATAAAPTARTSIPLPPVTEPPSTGTDQGGNGGDDAKDNGAPHGDVDGSDSSTSPGAGTSTEAAFIEDVVSAPKLAATGQPASPTDAQIIDIIPQAPPSTVDVSPPEADVQNGQVPHVSPPEAEPVQKPVSVERVPLTGPTRADSQTPLVDQTDPVESIIDTALVEMPSVDDAPISGTALVDEPTSGEAPKARTAIAMGAPTKQESDDSPLMVEPEADTDKESDGAATDDAVEDGDAAQSDTDAQSETDTETGADADTAADADNKVSTDDDERDVADADRSEVEPDTASDSDTAGDADETGVDPEAIDTVETDETTEEDDDAKDGTAGGAELEADDDATVSDDTAATDESTEDKARAGDDEDDDEDDDRDDTDGPSDSEASTQTGDDDSSNNDSERANSSDRATKVATKDKTSPKKAKTPPAPAIFVGSIAASEDGTGFDAPYQPSFKKVPLITKAHPKTTKSDGDTADTDAANGKTADGARTKADPFDPDTEGSKGDGEDTETTIPTDSQTDSRCVNGHRNSPSAALCSRCGERLNPTVTGDQTFMRPGVIGTLTFDDGEQYDVSNDLLVGRAPGTPVIGDTAEFPSDPMMSREHFRIEVDDHSVMVRDLNSSNGTMVRFTSDGGYERLMPGEAYPLSDGAVIVAGQRWATFALHLN